ncbi:uncharacterized protein LOC100887883 isoform X2 [Strongylocentrotus purpuratus]|uniref:Calx-beta domain-containing protein n=1 Tax=Strongylocentrotus purpuratus TaxID=7668 RepID=A0A7M7LTB1_STRPU|nr:uncharacterized protein LOC100887883 isoform X2 [Strongylocentrotus purpuratus]
MRWFIYLVTLLLVIFHLVSSQECPSGTPDGCRCQNRVFNCSGLGLNNMPTSLSSLSNFDVIDLSNNDLVNVPLGAFQNLPVQRIILKNNAITEIRPGGFDNLNLLTSINLEMNGLSILEQTGFNLLTSLTELLLAGNPVDCSNDANAWLKSWMVTADSSVLTGDCSSTGTISDALDSVAEPSAAVFSFEKAEYSALESAGVATVTVSRRGIVGTRVDFGVMVSDGVAVVNYDFVAPVDPRHTMLTGQTRMDLDILLIDDAEMEIDESFMVTIAIEARGEANMGTIGTYGTTIVIILDNDSPVQTTSSPVATTSNPESSTQAKGEPTDPGMMMTTDDLNQSPQPNTKSVNVAAIVIPIVLIMVIIAVIAGYIWYRRTRTINKETTAGIYSVL